jgi:hypothetical protein
LSIKPFINSIILRKIVISALLLWLTVWFAQPFWFWEMPCDVSSVVF